jgi:hypothetical protein
LGNFDRQQQVARRCAVSAAALLYCRQNDSSAARCAPRRPKDWWQQRENEKKPIHHFADPHSFFPAMTVGTVSDGAIRRSFWQFITLQGGAGDYIQFITFIASTSAGRKDTPVEIRTSEANKPTPQNRAIVLRLSTSVEIDGNAFDRALAIAVMADPLGWRGISVTWVGVGTSSCKVENGFAFVSELFRGSSACLR